MQLYEMFGLSNASAVHINRLDEALEIYMKEETICPDVKREISDIIMVLL